MLCGQTFIRRENRAHGDATDRLSGEYFWQPALCRDVRTTGGLCGWSDGNTNNGRPHYLHVSYHGGRLVTYALVGAICGLLGR